MSGLAQRGPGGAASPAAGDAEVIAATRRWLEVAVIGLGLCPFAAAVHRHQQIRYRVSDARDARALRQDLSVELIRLATSDASAIETTLLIHPRALVDWAAYNRFLGLADRTVARLGLRGVLQIASFHPAYRFAGSAADAIDNCTNRSPYPVLQLLREDSVERALTVFGEPHAIYRRNIERLRALGHSGWNALWAADSGADGTVPAC